MEKPGKYKKNGKIWLVIVPSAKRKKTNKKKTKKKQNVFDANQSENLNAFFYTFQWITEISQFLSEIETDNPLFQTVK